ncbi:MAG TPA: hypothetical protein VGK95_13320 [Caldimonas sp.]
MKGTATVTTTTTVKPVVVTEIRHGVVLKVWAGTVTVLDNTDGLRKRFTQDQLNERGLQIFKDGRVITISQLNKGDELSATIVSQRPPEVVTEQEVEATLAPSESKTESTPAKTESAPHGHGSSAGRRGAAHPTRCDSSAGCSPARSGTGRIVRFGDGVVRADRRGHRSSAVLCRAPAQKQESVSLTPRTARDAEHPRGLCVAAPRTRTA